MTEKEEYLADSIEIGLESPMSRALLSEKMKMLSDRMNVTQSVLKDVSYEWEDPISGNPVKNSGEANYWFTKNVYILFSTGKIFDVFDSEFFEEVLSYFDRDAGSVYIGCRYKVSNYEDTTVKRIEEKLALENGNYHLLAVVIVYATEENLEDAPEELFAARGIVKYCIDHDEIKELMFNFIDKYGLIVNEVGITKTAPNISARRDGLTLKEVKFKYTDDVDWNSGPCRELESDLHFRKERDEAFRKRTRIDQDARIFPRERHGRYRDQVPLYERMRQENVVDTTPQFMKQVGVGSKMVERIIPSEYVWEEENRVEHVNPYDGEMTQGETIARAGISGDYSALFNFGVDADMQYSVNNTSRRKGRSIKM